MTHKEEAVETVCEMAQDLRAKAKKLMALKSADAEETGRLLSRLADTMIEEVTEEPEE